MNLDVAKKLKMLRAENGLTQAQLAETLGVTQQTYSKYESGSSIDNNIITKICELYGISADYLLGIEPKGNKKKDNNNKVSYIVDDDDITTIVESVMKKIDGRSDKK
ncbi:MAG: helix-turn-helix domain-containing protein [Clostridia bacterium]|nr:helix-turn-helix domain-containing protein [Clostridia bacterium]